jgi:hypothetical protein
MFIVSIGLAYELKDIDVCLSGAIVQSFERFIVVCAELILYVKRFLSINISEICSSLIEKQSSLVILV